ncbi:MAG: hypothetical protein ACK47L_13920 [Pseudanabaena sp.]|nr:hypothetical protein [Pseudanabaena sp. M079S1SP2A07QC]MCA6606178.1 hypothetical protein [Pseudanabaena sp. M007S1SP1A06QC]MCA6621924.1 hypothetical protein [Pseudanabaena sp. M165S2SP1A06QC]
MIRIYHNLSAISTQYSDLPSKNKTNQRSPIHPINSDRLSKKQINQRSPIHPINSDRLSKKQINQRSSDFTHEMNRRFYAAIC